jgi:pimeloyl-ACP methyl ester carboxylesterase
MPRFTIVRAALAVMGSLVVSARPLFAQAAAGSGRLPEAPGRLIDIGGQRLHLNCTGRGSPTVVFENGAGDFSFVWSLVQPRVAELTRACSYDRAGYAWSDPGARPRTYDQIALELHTTLDRAGEHGPYVLVGQSYGGLLVRGYARRYPSDVAGLVLVDAVHEDERIDMGGKVQRISDFATGRVRPEPRIAGDATLITLRRSGPVAIPDTTPLESPLDRLPGAKQDAWRAASSDSVFRLSWAAEMDWSPEELKRIHADRLTNRVTLGDLPLIVISRAAATRPDSLSRERAANQRDLAALSRHGAAVTAAHSGHNVHLEEPAVVVSAIRRIVNDIRRNQK